MYLHLAHCIHCELPVRKTKGERWTNRQTDRQTDNTEIEKETKAEAECIGAAMVITIQRR